jgi:hypothetical protein
MGQSMGNLWEQHGIFTTNYMGIYGVSWKLPIGMDMGSKGWMLKQNMATNRTG